MTAADGRLPADGAREAGVATTAPRSGDPAAAAPWCPPSNGVCCLLTTRSSTHARERGPAAVHRRRRSRRPARVGGSSGETPVSPEACGVRAQPEPAPREGPVSPRSLPEILRPNPDILDATCLLFVYRDSTSAFRARGAQAIELGGIHAIPSSSIGSAREKPIELGGIPHIPPSSIGSCRGNPIELGGTSHIPPSSIGTVAGTLGEGLTARRRERADGRRSPGRRRAPASPPLSGASDLDDPAARRARR